MDAWITEPSPAPLMPVRRDKWATREMNKMNTTMDLADFRVWVIVAAVSGLEVCVALIPYNMGKRGLKAVLARFPQMRQERLERVQALYQKHGPGLLFFSFFPILGTMLAAGAGIVGVQMLVFALWVLLGRVTRNSVLAVLVVQGLIVLGQS